MSGTLPEKWQDFLLASGYEASLWEEPLAKSLARRQNSTVFPPQDQVFRAFALTPPDKVKIIILGQDPYHDDGQAEGLAFSVPDSMPLPPSLRNIFREFAADLNCSAPVSGHLGDWAAKGVLLLNAVLTVDAHTPGSHRKFGWQKFTDAVISALNQQKDKLVFILWGNYAAEKIPLIDPAKHFIVQSAHPSPLSAHRGFFGSKPFSAAAALIPGWRWKS